MWAQPQRNAYLGEHLGRQRRTKAKQEMIMVKLTQRRQWVLAHRPLRSETANVLEAVIDLAHASAQPTHGTGQRYIVATQLICSGFQRC